MSQNLNSLIQYTNKTGIIEVPVNTLSYVWFVVNARIAVTCNNIEVPLSYQGKDDQSGLFYYRTEEQIVSTINVDVVLLSDIQKSSEESDTILSPAATPTIYVPASNSSVTYTEGDIVAALTVKASSSDGGTLTFQWYNGDTKIGTPVSGTQENDVMVSEYTPIESGFYWCRVFNDKTGYSQSFRDSYEMAVTINVAAGAETNLTGFVEGYWNASGQKIQDSDYLSSPLIDVSLDKNFVIFNDITKTGKVTSPTHILSTWTDENTCRNAWEDSLKGRVNSVGSADNYIRFVIPNDSTRADYCFIKIGNNYHFRGVKVKDAFLEKIYAFGKELNSHGLPAGNDINIVTNIGVATDSDRSFTFIAGPFDLQSGHTYTFETGRTSNGTSELDVITFVDDNNKLVNYQYKRVSSFPNDSVKTIPSGATKFYLTCSFRSMHDCYLKDNGEYVWKGAKVE